MGQCSFKRRFVYIALVTGDLMISHPCGRYTLTFVQPNGGQLRKVVELIEAGKLKVPIHKVWPLDQAA